MARPDIAVLLNVAPAHLANFGSLGAISETKGALLDDLPANGLAVFKGDDVDVTDWQQRAAPTRCLTFGLNSDADYCAAGLKLQGFSGSTFMLQTPEHAIRCDQAGFTAQFKAGFTAHFKRKFRKYTLFNVVL